MRRGAVRGWMAAVLAVAATGCAYSPNPMSGALSCGPSNSCPEGYACDQGKCWTPSHFAAKPFIGSWGFTAASTLAVTCSDGTNSNQTLDGDVIEVLPGIDADLLAHYYCSFDLDVNGPGTKASLASSGQSCPFVSTDAKAYTVRGKSFDLTTSDGLTGNAAGMLEAQLSVGTGSCNINFSGALVKK